MGIEVLNMENDLMCKHCMCQLLIIHGIIVQLYGITEVDDKMTGKNVIKMKSTRQ